MGFCHFKLYKSQKKHMKERFIPKSIREKAQELGGTDFDDWSEYERPDTVPSFDKGGHKERSIANQPNHLDYWKKQWKGNQNET